MIFFSIRIFFTDTDDSQDSRAREGTIFYSTVPLPTAHEHWGIYLQLCMRDYYHVFLIATLVFTKLLLDEIYYLIELPFEWLIDDAMFVCLLDELILGFCYSDLTLETGGFKLASTITLVTLMLQVKRLTKCASHPKSQDSWVDGKNDESLSWNLQPTSQRQKKCCIVYSNILACNQITKLHPISKTAVV